MLDSRGGLGVKGDTVSPFSTRYDTFTSQLGVLGRAPTPPEGDVSEALIGRRIGMAVNCHDGKANVTSSRFDLAASAIQAVVPRVRAR